MLRRLMPLYFLLFLVCKLNQEVHGPTLSRRLATVVGMVIETLQRCSIIPFFEQVLWRTPELC